MVWLKFYGILTLGIKKRFIKIRINLIAIIDI
jgi:hypothetical protein